MDTNISRLLDHAVLKPEMEFNEAKEAIITGIKYNVKTVCVRPCDIEMAVSLCKGTVTDVSTVLSFPHGCEPSNLKREAAKQYIDLGAKEIDMVANYGYIRSGMYNEVLSDINAVSEITRANGILLKIILETAMLNEQQIKKAVLCAIEAKADFVKTSTGFNGRGASENDVRLMLEAASGKIGVKPSGGIRDYSRAKLFADMGCQRLGVNYTSTSLICEGIVSNDDKSNISKY